MTKFRKPIAPPSKIIKSKKEKILKKAEKKELEDAIQHKR